MNCAVRRVKTRVSMMACAVVTSFALTSGAQAQIDPADMVSGHAAIAAGPSITTLYTVPAGMVFVLTDFSWSPESIIPETVPPPVPWSETLWTVIVRLGDSSGDRWRGFAYQRVSRGFDDTNPQGQHAASSEDHHWPVEGHWRTGLVFQPGEDVILELAGTSFASGASWSGYLSPLSTSSSGPVDPQQVPRLGASPNPSQSDAKLDFSLSESQSVVLAIYNVAGRKVRELHRGDLAAGAHSLPWDGRDDRGRVVANGIYFARLELAGNTAVEKLIRVN